jgi:hypothetical protein
MCVCMQRTMPRNEGSILLADEQVCAPQHKKRLNFAELRKSEVQPQIIPTGSSGEGRPTAIGPGYYGVLAKIPHLNF